jgi:hypothetical protein
VGGPNRIQHTRPVSTLEANPVLGVDFGTQKQGQREGSPLWGALPLTLFWVSVLAPRTGLASGTKVTHQVGGRACATHTLKTDACAVPRLALMPDPCLGSRMCITSVIHTYIHRYTLTYIHRYTDTHIQTCIQAYMLANIHARIHTCMHTCIHTCMHAYIHTHTYTL